MNDEARELKDQCARQIYFVHNAFISTVHVCFHCFKTALGS